MVKQKEDCKRGSAAGLFIPAGLFAGMGIGFVCSQIAAGIFLGLGAGFIAMAITRALCKRNCK